MAGAKISGSVALVTGANRGIGRAVAEALLERGAAKVYATARDPKSLSELSERYGDRVVPLKLDVTDAQQVAAATKAATDVHLLFNNAGVALVDDLNAENGLEHARQEMEVNYFAPLRLTKQFTQTLARNGGGAVVNVSSVGGLTNFPFFPTYCASKAAIHSLTQAQRALLSRQGTAVFGVYPGPVDTDMARGLAMEKATPQDVANAVLDAMEAGLEDIFPDAFATDFAAQFESSPKGAEQQIAAMAQAAAAE